MGHSRSVRPQRNEVELPENAKWYRSFLENLWGTDVLLEAAAAPNSPLRLALPGPASNADLLRETGSDLVPILGYLVYGVIC